MAAAWLSAGTLAVVNGDAERVAALPPASILIVAIVAAVVAVSVARLRLSDAWPLAISALIALPFIPGNIPDAFLLWQGPIEWIVWLAVAAGLVYVRYDLVRLRGTQSAEAAKPRRWTADPARAPWIAALAMTTVSLIAFNQVRNVVPNGDEPHYLAATQSLISDRDLKVENNYARGDYLEYFSGRLQPHFLQRSASGEIYSIHSPGVSLLVLPGFLIAGYAGAVATVIVMAGLTAALTWTVAWRVSQSAAAAWIGVIAVYATAPLLFHTFTIYPDGAGALLVMIGAWLIVRLIHPTTQSPRRGDPGLDDDIPSQPQLAAAGAALAVLPWLHTRFALLSAVLGLMVVGLLATKRIRPTRIAAFLAVPAIAAAAWLAYFWIIWGTPSPLAPYGRDTESSVSYIPRGLAGLILDQQFGVLTTAPVYALTVPGLWALIRRRTRLAVALVLVAVPYVIAVSTYAMWWGGTSAPARFLGALLPLGAIAIAFAWATYAPLRIAILLLLLVSIALVVPRLTVDAGQLVFTSRNVFDATIEWLSRHVDLALALPSVPRDGPAAALMDGLPWLLAIVVLCGESIVVAMKRYGRGASWTLVALSGAAMVMFAATMTWMFRSAEPVTPERSILASFASRGRTRELEASAANGEGVLRLRRVPAGDYHIFAMAPPASGRIEVRINGNDPPLVQTPANVPVLLRLPIDVATLNIRADAAAPDGAPAIRLRPTARLRSSSSTARRGARYGPARVFFVDDRAYPESKGFWTRGEGRATIVIDANQAARDSGLPLTLMGGAAATTIGISVGEWSRSYSLTPGQRRDITLPPLTGGLAWVVDIHSGPGFRPFEREPGSTDVRLLAAWFEIP